MKLKKNEIFKIEYTNFENEKVEYLLQVIKEAQIVKVENNEIFCECYLKNLLDKGPNYFYMRLKKLKKDFLDNEENVFNFEDIIDFFEIETQNIDFLKEEVEKEDNETKEVI